MPFGSVGSTPSAPTPASSRYISTTRKAGTTPQGYKKNPAKGTVPGVKLNPYQRDTPYRQASVFGSTNPASMGEGAVFTGGSASSAGGGAGGGAGLPGVGGAGGAGASGGQVSVSPFDPLSISVGPDPNMQASIADYKARMNDLVTAGATPDASIEELIGQYRERMSSDPTERAIDRAASAIRDQMAGLQSQAEIAGEAAGRGPGYKAGSVAEAGQRALASSAADIALGREKDLDALLQTGTSIMGMPSQRQLSYASLANQLYSTNPYEATSGIGLANRQLGLEAWLGQLQAENERARTQADVMGRPIDYLSLLF